MTGARSARAMVMRGGTSKGLYFLAEDLPADTGERDALLLSAMGSPDARQIDGLGGAHPLTSKVAVVSAPTSADAMAAHADISYLFLQVMVEEPIVTDAQNCGNILAGVGPFAVERGLVRVHPTATEATVRIHMVNTGGIAVARFRVHNSAPVYGGSTSIAGVPGTGAAIHLDFEGTAGSSCGALLPTGHAVDLLEGIFCTLIDNGMPVVIVQAQDVGATGYETPTELEANSAVREIVERIRLAAGPRMHLGDVTSLSVPKMTLVAPPRDGGALCTRTFIPHRCHDAIGVLGAVSVATAALIGGTSANDVAALPPPGDTIVVEHPTGTFDASIDATITTTTGGAVNMHVHRAGIVRTARKLMDGVVFAATDDAGAAHT